NHLHRKAWSQARAAAIRARELLESESDSRWNERVDEALTDVNLVMQLDELLLRQADFNMASGPFLEKALPGYAELFAQYGIRVGADPASAAARIEKRSAPAREAVVAGLDNWLLVARRENDASQEWLKAVLQLVDSDPWRTSVRRAVAERDRDALEKLAVQDAAENQPPAALTTLAWALLEFRAFDAVIALLRPAQRRHPGEYWINVDLARALVLRQPPDNAEALRFFGIAHALRPTEFVVRNFGISLFNRQDWDGTIFFAQKEIDQGMDNANTHIRLGFALHNNGQWERARAECRKALEMNPNLGRAHGNLGLSFSRRGETDQAIAAYQRAIQLDPKEADYHYNLGNAYFLQKKFDAAL